jgi:hypothetical protein
MHSKTEFYDCTGKRSRTLLPRLAREKVFDGPSHQCFTARRLAGAVSVTVTVTEAMLLPAAFVAVR